MIVLCSEVHDLHIWSLSVGKPSLSAHLLASSDGKGVLVAATKMLASTYNIHHTTIQVCAVLCCAMRCSANQSVAQVEIVGDDLACNPLYAH